jgi:hypothetical protein
MLPCRKREGLSASVIVRPPRLRSVTRVLQADALATAGGGGGEVALGVENGGVRRKNLWADSGGGNGVVVQKRSPLAHCFPRNE